MEKIHSLEALLKPDAYQVFLCIKGELSRWEVLWRPDIEKADWGYIYKDYFPPTQGVKKFFFSEKYFWEDTGLLGVVEGGEDSLAKRMAECIESSPRTYDKRSTYFFALGPNSNTYVQWILNQFPEANMHLPWNAFGK